MKRATLRDFILFYALCFTVQAIGGWFTAGSVTTWYPTLHHSRLTPPGYVFGIVWTSLYFLMAVAATRVRGALGSFNNRPLRWWLVQLLLGLVWSILFFGNQAILAGLIIILAMDVAVLLTLRQFWQVDRRAGMLLLPLQAWLLLATYFNSFVYLHN